MDISFKINDDHSSMKILHFTEKKKCKYVVEYYKTEEKCSNYINKKSKNNKSNIK